MLRFPVKCSRTSGGGRPRRPARSSAAHCRLPPASPRDRKEPTCTSSGAPRSTSPRERLAVLYRLENPRKLSDTYTWRYDLVDLSRDNIRAIVNDPAIEDTHEIDREGYTLAPTAPRTARRQRLGEWGDTIVGIADALAMELLVLAGFALAMRTSIPSCCGEAFRSWTRPRPDSFESCSAPPC